VKTQTQVVLGESENDEGYRQADENIKRHKNRNAIDKGNASGEGAVCLCEV
jgi:hypothetical protein